MAFDAKPSSWITSWTEDGTSVTFALADLLQDLSAIEADALTGDWRDCIYSLLDHSYQYYAALADADKPVQVTIERVAQKHTDSIMKFTYTVEVYAAIASTDVTAE